MKTGTVHATSPHELDSPRQDQDLKPSSQAPVEQLFAARRGRPEVSVRCVIMYAEGGADTLTPEDAEDRALLAFLLNGKRLQPRRDSHRSRQDHVERPVDPAELDAYQLLLWEQAPHLSRAGLARAWLEWGALFTVQEARAWFAAGAQVHDLESPRKFHDAGVPPELAAEPVHRHGQPIGRTFLDLVRRGNLTAEQVRDRAVRAGRLPSPSRGSRGVDTPPDGDSAPPDERLTS